MLCCFFFFFQAEDGIRDIGVTGVQTCALPICNQGGRIGDVRRRDPHGALAGASQAGECRQKKRQLADAGLVSKDLRKPLAWPAAAGKLVVEGGEAARQRGSALDERAPAPHRMPLQDLLEGAHTVFSYSNGRLTSA